VDVRVGGDPSLRTQVGEAGNLQFQISLPRYNGEPLPDGFVLEPLGHFDVHLPDW
jgi:hypothetical protein